MAVRLVASAFLGNAQIDQLRRNSQAVAALPFLKNPPMIKKRSGCGCRGGGVKMQVDYDAVKQTIASLPDAGKQTLRQFLGAGKLRMTYVVNGRLHKKEI